MCPDAQCESSCRPLGETENFHQATAEARPNHADVPTRPTRQLCPCSMGPGDSNSSPELSVAKLRIDAYCKRTIATLAVGMSNSISSSTTRRPRVKSNDRRPRTPRGGLREGGWLRVKNRCSPRAAESPKSKGGKLPPWFLLCGGLLVTPECRACKVGTWRASLGASKRHPTKPSLVKLHRAEVTGKPAALLVNTRQNTLVLLKLTNQ